MPRDGQGRRTALLAGLAHGERSTTIVDRLVDFHDWPTWRKSRLLMAIALPIQAVLSTVAGLFASSSGIVDMAWLWPILGAGLGVVMICLTGAQMARNRGSDGGWTAYLILVLYGLWIGVLIVGLGVWSTAFIAWVPLVTILLGLWYGERVGWVTLGFAVTVLLTMIVLVLAEVVPFAPLIEDRRLDAQSSVAFVGLTFAGFVGYFGYTFLLMQLTVRTRKRQSQRLDEAGRLIARYVPASVAAHLVDGHVASDGFRPQRVKLTVFFSDIEGFTDAADQLDPEDLSTVLDTYFADMADVAEAHGASVNQFIGDAIMVFFGAPVAGDDRDNALRAVGMAQAMQHRLSLLRHRWIRQGIRAPFHARMGINTGYASVGDFGSPGRTVYTAVGTQANIAARIQAHCPPDGIWIADTTYHLVRDDVPCADRGELVLKGVHFPVHIYEVLDHDPAATTQPDHGSSRPH